MNCARTFLLAVSVKVRVTEKERKVGKRERRKERKKGKKGAGAQRGGRGLVMGRLFAAGDAGRDWHRISFLRVAIV